MEYDPSLSSVLRMKAEAWADPREWDKMGEKKQLVKLQLLQKQVDWIFTNVICNLKDP